jgi:hypothetical protein
MVPPALLRWLAVRLGQTGRFALPSLVVVVSCISLLTRGDNNDIEMDGGTAKNEHTDSCGEPALPPKKQTYVDTRHQFMKNKYHYLWLVPLIGIGILPFLIRCIARFGSNISAFFGEQWNAVS